MRKNLICKFISPFLVIFTVMSLHAQEDEGTFGFDVSADLVSRYVWRGLNLSSSPAIQPTLDLSWRSFSLGSWASYSVSPEPFQEVDLYLSYTAGFMTLTLNDYYNPVDTVGFEGNYFDWGSQSTSHTLEGMIMLTGPESFPVSFTAALMFYGNDRDEENDNLYSTYLELGYAKDFRGLEVNPFIGFTPCKGYYAEKAAFVNIGITVTKNLQITEQYQLPLWGSFTVNPAEEKVNLVFGITL